MVAKLALVVTMNIDKTRNITTVWTLFETKLHDVKIKIPSSST
ncbi:MAG: hypothetical protein V4651_10710 [Bacteroidota bacterium]